MTVLFVILIVVASAVLGFIVLVQNPKGGGLSGSIAGFSNQFMGVKQTTDVLEKGTWAFAAIVALLCIFSAVFIPKTVSTGTDRTQSVDTRTTTPPPAATPPVQQTTPVPAK
ncbi:MAG: preprotein translocase subunit SecG [Sphingobacteriales bacterium]|nr:MAG: preprotein translocase subunit SecG [Sphingobacteriales bacterium]